MPHGTRLLYRHRSDARKSCDHDATPSVWTGLIALVIFLGIGSRRFAASLPGVVAAYAGDTLWATAAFLGIGQLLPRAST